MTNDTKEQTMRVLKRNKSLEDVNFNKIVERLKNFVTKVVCS